VTQIWKTLTGSVVTRARLGALGLFGLLTIGIGVALGVQTLPNKDLAAFGLVDNLGLALLVPIPTLVFASAALGDLVDDSTLVYLWLKPVGRTRIVVSAWGAALTASLPMVVVPVTAAAALTGVGWDLVRATAVSSALAVLAYSAVFVGLGLVVRRALAWGLGYIVLWEGIIASLGSGPARASIRGYAASILSDIANGPPVQFEVSVGAAATVLSGIVIAALVLTTLRLRRQSVP
jgi:ABC-2 type transport system permease protein